MSAPTHPALEALRAKLARAAIPALEALLAERNELRAALETTQERLQSLIQDGDTTRAQAALRVVRAALAKGDS